MIKIDTIGYGSVEIVEDETFVIFNATPIKGCDFKEFSINGITTKDNPYSIEKSGDITGTATFYQSINSYLQNIVLEIDVSRLIPGILMFRDIEYGTDVKELDKRDIELCKADVFYECTSIPSSRQQERDADGGWKHDKGGFSMNDFTKKSLITRALTIYTKYGDERAKEIAPERTEINAEFLGL